MKRFAIIGTAASAVLTLFLTGGVHVVASWPWSDFIHR